MGSAISCCETKHNDLARHHHFETDDQNISTDQTQKLTFRSPTPKEFTRVVTTIQEIGQKRLFLPSQLHEIKSYIAHNLGHYCNHPTPPSQKQNPTLPTLHTPPHEISFITQRLSFPIDALENNCRRFERWRPPSVTQRPYEPRMRSVTRFRSSLPMDVHLSIRVPQNDDILAIHCKPKKHKMYCALEDMVHKELGIEISSGIVAQIFSFAKPSKIPSDLWISTSWRESKRKKNNSDSNAKRKEWEVETKKKILMALLRFHGGEFKVRTVHTHAPCTVHTFFFSRTRHTENPRIKRQRNPLPFRPHQIKL